MNMHHSNIIIDLRDVSKVYETGAGPVTVLKNIDLKILEGQFVSVVGPSGSGKSTLLNILTGIDHPTTGEIFVAEQALHILTEDQLAQWRGRNIGIVFQFFQLLPTLTILENVKLPMDFCNVYERNERITKAAELLSRVGISEHADKLPSALSGGEQQRAAIARALANDPSVIVADEPTGNLDSETSNEIFNIFNQFVQMGKTLLVVTHDQELSKKTERVIHLLDGKICLDELNQDGNKAAQQKEISLKFLS